MLVIRNLEMLDFDFLESVVLCEVEDYQVIPVESFNSVSARIELIYGSEKRLDAPESVFIKLKKEGEGEIEYRFYEQEKGDYFPHCYHNAYDRETGYSHLVLEDLSQDYHAPVSREDLIGLNSVPAKELMERIIDSVAALHRNHWERKDNWEIPYYFRSDEAFAKRMQQYRDDLAAFNAKGYEIPKEWHGYFEASLEELPKIWQENFAPRFAAHRQLTLIHGDCYISQFLVNEQRVYMADFDSVAFSLPTDDLIYLMVNFWTREQRASYEKEMMRRYLEQLGQANYTWDDLVRDYRAMLHFRIFHAVWDAITGSSERYWRSKMPCLIHAYEDWCR
jgi:hypothetical protein